MAKTSDRADAVSAVLSMAFAGLLAMACTARASVYDDAAAWWHLDYDANGDDVVQLDEVRDQCDWGMAATKGTQGKHATSIHGEVGTPAWTNIASLRPAGGQEYGGRSLVLHPAVDGSDNVYPAGFKVSNLSLSGSATLVTRLRYDGPAVAVEVVSWLYNNAFDYGGDKGWLFGVRNAGHNLCLLFGNGHWHDAAITLTPGEWYELAVVVTDDSTNDSVEFYVWSSTGDLQYQKLASTTINSTVGATGTLVGGETTATGYSAGNARKAFNGIINHLAVWNRALSFEEVNEAFGAPQPVFTLGLDNDRNGDLRIEGEVDATYLIGEPWHTMRRAVSSGKETAEIQFSLSATQAALDYVFHLETDGMQSGLTAAMTVLVNGHDMGQLAVQANHDYFWPVYAGALVTGYNTLTLRYDGGPSAWISFDWMELAGSWQVGVDDGTQGEFENENNVPDYFFVTDPDWKDLERAHTATDPDINLHFALSPELAAGYRYVYTTRVVQQGNGTHAFDILANGTLMRSYPAQPDGTLVTAELGSSVLVSGDNVITLHFNDTTGWTQYDFHRLLLTAIPPTGTVFILR